VRYVRLSRLPDPDQPDNREFDLDFAVTLRQVVKRPVTQGGADITEMRQGIRLLDALDACDSDVLALEDADWENLKAKTLAMPWAVIDRRILRLIDAVLDALPTPPLELSRVDGQTLAV
jgi:hypothetical protein